MADLKKQVNATFSIGQKEQEDTKRRVTRYQEEWDNDFIRQIKAPKGFY